MMVEKDASQIMDELEQNGVDIKEQLKEAAKEMPEMIKDTVVEGYKKIEDAAAKLGMKCNLGRIHSSDVFYAQKKTDYYKDFGCDVVEMESFALFANANLLGKHAACLLTVSVNFFVILLPPDVFFKLMIAILSKAEANSYSFFVSLLFNIL